MRFNLSALAATWLGKRHSAKTAIIVFLMLWCGLSGVEAQQCSFSSPSDGSDGNYDLTGTPAGTTVYFKSTDFHGSGVAKNVFNFGTITVPANVTVKFSENVFHGPVYWLAQSDVTIAGTLDLRGADGVPPGTDPTTRVPAPGGSGGYPGGIGGGGTQGLLTLPGGGPGGGAAGSTPGDTNGNSGTFAGSNAFLIPLVGGSGGGGGNATTGFGPGGAGGGGAILIASTTSIAVPGTITVNGGNAAGECSSAGSGGAIRLVSTAIVGTGTVISAPGSLPRGGFCPSGLNGTDGVVRLESCTISTSFTSSAPTYVTTPVKLFLPTSPSPAVQVTSVNGVPITENPFTFPDISINTASGIPVVITAHQIPIGTIPILYIFSESGDQQLTCPMGLQGTLAASTCTISLTFPFGGSRGFVKATWTQ